MTARTAPNRNKRPVSRTFALLATLLLLSPVAAAAFQDRPDYTAVNDNDPEWDYSYTVNLTQAEVQRFLDLWTPRVLDTAWFETFLSGDGIPASILAEGFHGLDQETKKYLANKLVHHLAEDTILDPATGLPDPAHQQRQLKWRTEMLALSAADQMQRLSQTRHMMYNFIFAKEEFRQSLTRPDNTLPVDAPLDNVSADDLFRPINETWPEVPAVTPIPELAIPSLLPLDPATLYDEVLANRSELYNGTVPPTPLPEPTLPVEPGNITSPETLYGAFEQVNQSLPDLFFGNATDITLPADPHAGETPVNETAVEPILGDPTGIASPQDLFSVELPADVNASVPPTEGALPVPTDDPFTALPLDSTIPIFPFTPTQTPVPMPDGLRSHWELLRNTVDATTYTACWLPAGGTVTCMDGIVGQPVLVGPATFLFSTTVDVSYPSGFVYDVRIQAPEGAKAKAWVIFEVPTTVYQVDVGFDGRADGLSPVSKIRGIVKDTTKLLNREMPLKLSVSYEGTVPPKQHLVFALREMRVAESCATCFSGVNPMAGELFLDPAPATYSADLRLWWHANGATYTIDGALAATTTMKAFLEYRPSASAEKTEYAVEVRDLPTSFRVNLERTNAGTAVFQYSDTTAGAIPFASYQHTVHPNRNDADDYTQTRIEVDGVPDSVQFSIETPFKMVYTASAVITQVRFSYLKLADGMKQPHVHGRLDKLPASLTLSVPQTERDVDAVYTADAAIERLEVNVLFERRVSATVVDKTVLFAEVQGIPKGITVKALDEGYLHAVASEPITLFRGHFSYKGATVDKYDGDHAQLRLTSAGLAGASWQVRGLKSVSVDQRTTDTVKTIVEVSGGNPFRAVVDTPQVKMNVDVSALPGRVEVTASPDKLDYLASARVAKVGIELTIGQFEVSTILYDLPKVVNLAWTTGAANHVTYTTDTSLARLHGKLKRGNVLVTADVSGIPTSMKIGYDAAAPRAELDASSAIASAAIQVQVNGGALQNSSAAAEQVVVVKAADKLGVNLRVNGVQRVLADHAGGMGKYEIRMSPGGQRFVAQASIDGTTQIVAIVNALPVFLQATWNPAGGRFDYTSDRVLSNVRVDVSYKHTGGREANATIASLPAAMTLDWATGATTSALYTANGPLGTVWLTHKAPEGARLDLGLTSLPNWLSATIGKTSVAVDARTGSAAAPGSGSVGSILVQYGSAGQFLTGAPASDHAVLRSTTTGPTQVSLRYDGLMRVSVDTANDEIHAFVKNTNTRVFVLGADTSVSKLSATVSKVPSSVQIDLVGGVLTYAGSSVVDQVDLAFDDLNGLLVDLVLKGLPTSVKVNWNKAGPVAGYEANAPMTQLSGRIRLGGATVGTADVDHVYAVHDGANALAVDFRLTGWKKATADFTNGGKYALETGNAGLPFQGNAKLFGGDTLVTLDVAQMPSSMTLDFQSPTNTMTYSGAAANRVNFTYEKRAVGRLLFVNVVDVPATMSANWVVGIPAKLCYTASTTLGDLSVHYREATNGKTLDAQLRNIPQWMCAEFANDLVTFDARTSSTAASGSGTLEHIRAQYGSHGSFLTGLPAYDHAVLVQANGVTQASLLYGGLQQLSVSTANDEVHALVKNVGPKAFGVGFATGTSRVSAYLDQMPATSQVDYANGVLTYGASGSVATVGFNLDTLGGTLVDVTLKAVPTSVKVTWSKTGPKATYEANAPLGELKGKVRLGGASVGTIDQDHVYVVQGADVNALAIDFRLTGWKKAVVDLTSGGNYALEIDPAYAGKPFAVNAALKGGDVLVGLSVSAMPTSMTADFQSGTNKVTYAGVAASDVRVQYAQLSTGRIVDASLRGIPTSVAVSWVVGAPTKVTYDSNGRLGQVVLQYQEATNGKALVASASNLAPYMVAEHNTDLATFDARTSAGAAAGSDSVGAFTVLYGSDGRLLTGVPTGDHAVLLQAGGQTHLSAVYNGLKQVSVNTANDEVHATLKSAAPLAFVYGFDTPTSKVSGVVDQVPASVQIDYKAGSLTYAASSVIGALSFYFDDRAGLQVDVALNGVPTGFTLTWDRAASKYAFSANAPVSAIRTRVRYNGVDAGTDGGAHLYVKQTATGWGVDALVVNLQKVTFEPTNGGFFHIGGSSNTVTFTAAMWLADGATIVFQTGGMPNDLKVDMRHGAKSIEYGGAAFNSWAFAQYVKGGMALQGKLTSMPTSAKLNWTTGATGGVTYSASGTLGSAEIFYRENTGATTFYGYVQGVPAWWQANVNGNTAHFDARTSAGAAAGSASVGLVALKYASNEAFLGGVPTVSHAVVLNDGATHVDVLYAGLKLLRATAAGDKFDVAVQNANPVPFWVQVETAGERLQGYVQNVPASVSASYDGATVKYAASSTIERVYMDLDKKSSAVGGTRRGEWIAVDAYGVPATLDVVVDFANSKVAWTASSALTYIGAKAQGSFNGRLWTASAGVSQVPATGSVTWASQHPVFSAPAGVGGIGFWVTNHDGLGVLGGAHVNAVYDSGSGNLHASATIYGLKTVDVDRTATGYTGTVETTAGGSFTVNLDYTDGAKKAIAQMVFWPLPGKVTFSQADDAFTFTATSSFHVYGVAAVGNGGGIAQTPNPPLVHGFSLRDGSGCVGSTCGNAVKAAVYFEGMPTSVSFDGSERKLTLGAKGASPSGYNYFQLDLALTKYASPALVLQATQTGLNAGYSATFGPFSATSGTDTKTVSGSYSANAGLGALAVYVAQGTNAGYLYLSNVPATLSVSATFGKTGSSARMANSAGIGYAQAQVKASAGDASYGALLQLTDVPATMDLSFGRTTASPTTDETLTAPTVTYTGSAYGLDAWLQVHASLFGGDVKAKALLWAENMGTKVTGSLSGSELTLKSEGGRTGRLWLFVWAQAKWLKTFDKCLPSCTPNPLALQVKGHAGINPASIEALKLGFTDFSTATVKFGLVNGFKGDYGTVIFGYEKFSITFDFETEFFVLHDFWLLPAGKWRVTGVTVHHTEYVHDSLRIAADNLGGWWDFTVVGCGVHAQLRPMPYANAQNEFWHYNPGASWNNAIIATHNPWVGGGPLVPPLLVDVIAAAHHPWGNGGVKFFTGC